MSNAIRICPHVYQVGGAELTHPEDCCVYLMESRGEGAIIDTGTHPSEQLLTNIIHLGISLSNIRYIFITHGHIDHIGGLHHLSQRLKAHVVAHRLDLPAIEEGRPELTAAWFYGVDYQPTKIDVVLDRNQHFPLGDLDIHCMHTPGHTPGSISLYVDVDQKRVLFGQDIHGPFNRQWGSDLGQWRKSMQQLLDLKPDLLCEGHFGVYEPADRVSAYIHSYLRRYEN